MNRKTGAVVLIFLFAAMVLISGCVQNKKAEAPVNRSLPKPVKGMKA